MIYLVPFDESHIPALIGWIHNKEELILFSGPTLFTFPITADQVRRYLADPIREVFAVMDNYTNEVLGMGEIIHDSEPGTARFCRILLGNPAYRGKGIGEQTVLAMLQHAFSDPGLQRVELNVFENNPGAIRCYEKCGFKPYEKQEHNPTDTDRNGWKALRMYIDRQATA